MCNISCRKQIQTSQKIVCKFVRLFFLLSAESYRGAGTPHMPPEDNRKRAREDKARDAQRPSKVDRACNSCGEAGHTQWKCPTPFCHACGESGHIQPSCDMCTHCRRRGHAAKACTFGMSPDERFLLCDSTTKQPCFPRRFLIVRAVLYHVSAVGQASSRADLEPRPAGFQGRRASRVGPCRRGHELHIVGALPLTVHAPELSGRIMQEIAPPTRRRRRRRRRMASLQIY